MTTGWLCHELWNFPAEPQRPAGHAYENPESKRRFRNLVEVSGLLDHLAILKPRYATEDEIARVHTRAHIEKIKTISAAGGGDASQLTPFGRGSFEIALLAADSTTMPKCWPRAACASASRSSASSRP